MVDGGGFFVVAADMMVVLSRSKNEGGGNESWTSCFVDVRLRREAQCSVVDYYYDFK